MNIRQFWLKKKLFKKLEVELIEKKIIYIGIEWLSLKNNCLLILTFLLW